MLGQCWAGVVDGGPALAQHRANASCLLVVITFLMMHDAARRYADVVQRRPNVGPASCSSYALSRQW